MCSVYVIEQDKVINIASEHLEPIPPEVGNKVWNVVNSEQCTIYLCLSSMILTAKHGHYIQMYTIWAVTNSKSIEFHFYTTKCLQNYIFTFL